MLIILGVIMTIALTSSTIFDNFHIDNSTRNARLRFGPKDSYDLKVNSVACKVLDNNINWFVKWIIRLFTFNCYEIKAEEKVLFVNISSLTKRLGIQSKSCQSIEDSIKTSARNKLQEYLQEHVQTKDQLLALLQTNPWLQKKPTLQICIAEFENQHLVPSKQASKNTISNTAGLIDEDTDFNLGSFFSLQSAVRPKEMTSTYLYKPTPLSILQLIHTAELTGSHYSKEALKTQTQHIACRRKNRSTPRNDE